MTSFVKQSLRNLSENVLSFEEKLHETGTMTLYRSTYLLLWNKDK